MYGMRKFYNKRELRGRLCIKLEREIPGKDYEQRELGEFNTLMTYLQQVEQRETAINLHEVEENRHRLRPEVKRI